MLPKIFRYASIFALCAIFFALLGCRSAAPQIVQQTQNIAFDTITIRDTTHEHSTEKYYIKEIWHVDTLPGKTIKETFIVHDQQKNVDGKSQTTAVSKSTSTQLQPKKKSSGKSVIKKISLGIFILFLVASIFVFVAAFKHTKG